MLTDNHLVRLKAFAEGRGETFEQAIHAILEFYAAENSDQLFWPLGDAVAFYLDNYVVD